MTYLLLGQLIEVFHAVVGGLYDFLLVLGLKRSQVREPKEIRIVLVLVFSTHLVCSCLPRLSG